MIGRRLSVAQLPRLLPTGCSLRNITKLGRHKHNYFHLISTPIGSKHLLYPAGSSLCWSWNIYCCDVIEFNVDCGLLASFPLSRSFILNYFVGPSAPLSDCCDPTKTTEVWDLYWSDARWVLVFHVIRSPTCAPAHYTCLLQSKTNPGDVWV